MKLALIASFIIASFWAQFARGADAPLRSDRLGAGAAAQPASTGAHQRRVPSAPLAD